MTFESLKARLTSENHLAEVQNEVTEASKELANPNSGEALKRKLMLERGGAQYRRVRKIAEESSRNNFSITHGHHSMGSHPMVRGLVGINNMLEVEPKSKNVAPSFYPHNPQNNRKGSMEMYFKKQIRASDYNGKKVYLNGDELEVKCFGNRIPIRR